MVKAVPFAFIVVVIASLRGLEAKGGPMAWPTRERVGRASSVFCIS